MWAVSDFIKRSWYESIYFPSFGTIVQISRIWWKEGSFSRRSFVCSHICENGEEEGYLFSSDSKYINKKIFFLVAKWTVHNCVMLH